MRTLLCSSLEGIANLRFVGFVVEVSWNRTKLLIEQKYCKALEGLESFSHAIIIYWLHNNDTELKRKILRVTPKRHPGEPELGVFATRSPVRPNPLAFEVCKILKINNCSLWVEESDAFEKTPIVDIKPYIPRADGIKDARVPDGVNR
jgi:tRNA-Thr(GGU) m(6)t(6)A37 methyltransferase TsaA